MKPKKDGNYYARPHWKKRANGLTVRYNPQVGKFYYRREYNPPDQQHPSEEALSFNDFILVDKECNKIDEDDIRAKRNYKEKEMDKDYIGGDYHVVEVAYNSDAAASGDTHMFKIDLQLAESVNIGDLVVVDSKYGYDLAKVVNMIGNSSGNAGAINKAKAWIVDKVDMADHQARKDATERKKYIMKQLDEKKEAMQELAIYKMLADSDPEASKLLEELEQLNK